MKKAPRYTDQARFARPYVPAIATNVRRTFERVRRELSKPQPVKESRRES